MLKWIFTSIPCESINDSILFSPIRKRCNYCNVEVVTYVEHEGHPMFLLIAIIVVLIFGFLSLVILPVGYLATKNAVHRCSRCLQKMGEKRCFGIPTNFADEVRLSSDSCDYLDMAIPFRQMSCCDLPRLCCYCPCAFLDLQSLLCVHETKLFHSSDTLRDTFRIKNDISYLGGIPSRLRRRGSRRK